MTVVPWLQSFGAVTAGMLAQKNLKLHVEGNPAAPSAVLGVRDRSVVYPVIPHEPSPQEARNLAAVFPKLLDSLCLMGPQLWVERAEALLPGFRRQREVAYDFMTSDLSQTPFPPVPPGFRVSRATVLDAAKLFPLQESYEKEEVLFSPDEFHSLASWMAFQQVLRSQLVLVLWQGKRPVAMARTNARHGLWAQIGGVYTLPSERRKGFQKILMRHLMATLALENQGACLFVKKDNLAAFNLYFELGFGEPRDFRISYWLRARGDTGGFPPKTP